jgi:hypothetical protein
LKEVLDTIRKDSEKFKEEMGAQPPREVQAGKGVKIPRGTPITVVPACEGIAFNPELVTFRWEREYHRTIFELTGTRELAGRAANGDVNIFAGPLLLARISFSIFFDTKEPAVAGQSYQEDTAKMFDVEDVFISYAHMDTDVVNLLKDFIKAFGHRIWIDTEDLQTGEIWSEEIERAIETADVFQLFWSQNAANSKYVRREYEYALERKKPVCPVYWTPKLEPNPPAKLSRIQFGRIPPDALKV